MAADQVYFYYTDPAGTPLAMSDASGNVVWRASYIPFGEESVDVSTVQNNKMFVGKEKDSETGLHYFGARYMDSPTGRFISPDSISPVDPHTGEINQLILHEPQRINSYSYALNNPFRYVDDNGKNAGVMFTALVAATTLYLLALMHLSRTNNLNREKTKSKFYSTSSQSSTGNPNDEEPDKKGSQGDKDTQSEVKRFSKKSLKKQINEYNNTQETYKEHLEKYGQEAGKTTGETNRIERQLQEFRRILEQRGRTFNSQGDLIE